MILLFFKAAYAAFFIAFQIANIRRLILERLNFEASDQII